MKVLVVALRDDAVHQSSPLRTSAVDECLVRWRHDYQGEQPYVVRQSFIYFVVPFEFLMLPRLQTAIHALVPPVLHHVVTLYHHEVRSVAGALGVKGVVKALAVRQEVDAVKHVRLPGAVMTYQAIDLLRKGQVRFPYVLEVDEVQSFQVHDANVRVFLAFFVIFLPLCPPSALSVDAPLFLFSFRAVIHGKKNYLCV